MKMTMERITDLKRRLAFSLALLISVGSGACATISPYSPVAYQQATSLKAESLSVLEKATTAYDDHRAEAETLRLDLDKAFEYAKGRPKNEISTQQWALIREPNKHLVGGVLKRWQSEGKLSAIFVAEVRGQISDAFDYVIGLEIRKNKD